MSQINSGDFDSTAVRIVHIFTLDQNAKLPNKSIDATLIGIFG